MFLNDPLANALSTDRQARFRRAARRQRLVSRNKVPPTEGPPASLLLAAWPDETDQLPSQSRARCVA